MNAAVVCVCVCACYFMFVAVLGHVECYFMCLLWIVSPGFLYLTQKKRRCLLIGAKGRTPASQASFSFWLLTKEIPCHLICDICLKVVTGNSAGGQSESKK